MDVKTVVGYVTYVVGAVALIALVASNPVITGALVISGLVNVFYVRR